MRGLLNSSDLLHTIIRWSHLISGAAWMGGIIFWLLVLNPTTKKFQTSNEYLNHITDDFKRLVDTCIFVLLATGAIITFNRITPGNMGANYLILLGIKITLIVIMIFIIKAKRPKKLNIHKSTLTKFHGSKLNGFINLLTGYNILIILGAMVFLVSDILHNIYITTLQN